MSEAKELIEASIVRLSVGGFRLFYDAGYLEGGHSAAKKKSVPLRVY
jgi:hypothetical protein